MGQLVLGSIGSAVGQHLLPKGLSAFGLHLSGQAIGAFIGAQAGGFVDRALFGKNRVAGPRLDALPVQSSTEGAPIPLVFGRSRIAGQIIWASRYSEHRNLDGGGKGGPRVSRFSYSVSFAVGLCEGEIDGVGSIRANGELLNQSDFAFRLYKGCEDQLPDPLIAAIEGADNAPAFRGLAYIVFEALLLEAFGNRIPNLSFEVFRAPQGSQSPSRMESKIRGVDLIPASGEFAYATSSVLREDGPGRQSWLNINNSRGKPDFLAAIDDLESQLPNCRSVLIVSAWFGSDLRCGMCEIRPGVETREKTTRPYSWQVAGEDRSTAYLITQTDGSPVYGGTPTDTSLIEAISDLKSRGFSVSLYPFILMDIPSENGLADPYGGAEQAAFPWRGRITCHPAPGEADSVDGSAIAAEQVDTFFGTASAADFNVSHQAVVYSGSAEWGFRRFILHHAAIAAAAGGVDGFLIGSEMRGLTTIRGEADTFPAVAHLEALASEARALLGEDTRLSYAADWSEYSGYQPQDGSGDVFFHLDALWSHPDIDAVAIDWYAPLSDWRDGDGHLDEALAASIHDPAYLRSNVEGGEGYDWYYASAADRDAQVRTPIEDGAYAKPWAFRYKDIRNWWANAHHDRKAGIELANPTSWVPESKPVWFTELGCPAIDKGGNQPNVFVDPKSAESLQPHYSSGARDDLIQRRYIETVLDYWAEDGGHNPVSGIYGGPMIAAGLIHVWTWDARPFPDFPARSDIWSDSANWRLGHWLNGRAGLAPLSLVLDEIAERSGLPALSGALDGLVSGFVIDQPMAARDALAPLMAAYGFSVVDRAGGPEVMASGRPASADLAPASLVMPASGQVMSVSLTDCEVLPRDVRLRYQLDRPDYRPSSLYARRETADLEAVADVSLPLLADEITAEGWARDILADAHIGARQWQFTLAPSSLAFEAGDTLALEGDILTLDAVTGLSHRSIEASTHLARAATLAGSVPSSAGDPAQPAAQPLLTLIDLPPQPGERAVRGGFLAATHANAWPGIVDVWSEIDAEWRARSSISEPTPGGVVITAPGEIPDGRWVEAKSLTVEMFGGVLSSDSHLRVLAGANRLAIRGINRWFTLQFRNAELVGERRYRLSGLLADGPTDFTDLPENSRCVVLDATVSTLGMEAYAGCRAAFIGIGRLSGTGSTASGSRPSQSPPRHRWI
jgi:Gene Transfer Agent (GTA)-like protein/putative tail protein